MRRRKKRKKKKKKKKILKKAHHCEISEYIGQKKKKYYVQHINNYNATGFFNPKSWKTFKYCLQTSEEKLFQYSEIQYLMKL